MSPFFIILLFAISCKSSPSAGIEVLALKEMNELVTVEYVVNKIIRANDDKTWYKPGDRKILMTCQATLKAGVDFSLIAPENIVVDGKQISLVLPRATLFSVNIKPEDIKMEYEEVGVFRSGFTAAERDVLAAQAQRQIQQSVDSLGILATAETNASLFVSNLLRKMGYRQVSIRFDVEPIQKLN
ncbi:MAG: DUF4230 domain-containing protein [Chitinophagaceae bacterium]|nr:DUF4230 domain-containing protein [Chitinophagaceae bacterium]MCW5929130.1 DUF4230 domain-containing protein [Chitinophagaceae bacterium]